MFRIPISCLCLAALIGFGEAEAADYSDPSWPCVQRKVENLSLGLMWPQPVDEAPLPEQMIEDAKTLAGTLELRRVDLDEAEVLIEAFVTDHPGVTEADMGKIFSQIFSRINRDRRALIGGIGEYSAKQITLAARIDKTRGEMDRLMEATDPDFDAVDKLEEQLDWDERVYLDRSRSLTYVCETPVLLEKRLYALAQLFQAAIPE